jgi:hypothetical protein
MFDAFVAQIQRCESRFVAGEPFASRLQFTRSFSVSLFSDEDFRFERRKKKKKKKEPISGRRMTSRKKGAAIFFAFLCFLLVVELTLGEITTELRKEVDNPAVTRKKWGEVDPNERGPDYVPGLPPPLPPLANPKPRDQVKLEDVVGSWEVSWGSGMSFLMSFMPDNQLVLGKLSPSLQKSLKYEFDTSVAGSLRVKFWDLGGIRTCPPEQIGIYEIQLSENCNEMRFILVKDECWRRSKARPRMTLTRDPPVLNCKSAPSSSSFPLSVIFLLLILILSAIGFIFWLTTSKHEQLQKEKKD